MLAQWGRKALKVVSGVGAAEGSRRPGCLFPWEEATILCDGTVVCGCADTGALRPLGNIGERSLAEIWRGPAYAALREEIRTRFGRHPLCYNCSLAVDMEGRDYPDLPPLPRRAHVELTTRCNLACPGCDTHRVPRAADLMTEGVFRRVLEGLGPDLEHLGWFVDGESFLHPRALDWLALARAAAPGAHLRASTNGHFLKGDGRKRGLVESGLDEIIFSVDGARAESYGRYRVGGRHAFVLEEMRRLLEIRRELGSETPRVVWRYILFRWNDSEEEMAEARRLAAEIGVDRLAWRATRNPLAGYSRRFRPGSPDWERVRAEMY